MDIDEEFEMEEGHSQKGKAPRFRVDDYEKLEDELPEPANGREEVNDNGNGVPNLRLPNDEQENDTDYLLSPGRAGGSRSPSNNGGSPRPFDMEMGWLSSYTARQTFSFFVLLLILASGFLSGVAFSELRHAVGVPEHDVSYYTSFIVESISEDRLSESLKYFTEKAHVAGMGRNYELAKYIKDQFEALDLRAEIIEYNVLLPFPNATADNFLSISDGNSTIFRSEKRESPLGTEKDDPDVSPPFNGYAKTGTVENGKIVYVNYGRKQDFDYLVDEKKIDLNGTIALARYGKIFRGDKATQAAAFGCAGLIIFSDPEDYAVNLDEAYPNGWWLPKDGIQRGSLYMGVGDPSTPGYPSTPGAPHLADPPGLPTIPVMPMSYGDAEEVMSRLGGEEAPEEWKGGLQAAYHLGPGFEDTTLSAHFEVHSNITLSPIYNVIGVMDGVSEPDRQIILGNHRDAWVYGASDPSSGTACLMEVARTFSLLRHRGWNPARSIVFASWDAEEEGLIGSSEYGEQYRAQLSQSAVAYLNVDIAVQGNKTLAGKASPNLKDLMYETSKMIPYISDEYATLFDAWQDILPGEDAMPSITKLGSGSDFTVFLQHIGMATAEVRFDWDPRKYDVSSYPTYHSVHDSYDWMSKFVDPGFKAHAAVAKMWAVMALRLATDRVLPINWTTYATALRSYVRDLQNNYGEELKTMDISLDRLQQACGLFANAAKRLHNDIESKRPLLELGDPTDVLKIRTWNDKLYQTERSFIDVMGLPGRPWYRHIVFAPSSLNSYAGVAFAGIVDALLANDKELTETQIASASAIVEHAAKQIIEGLRLPL
eukprot:Clim_evm4s136 gene=Clim_evmTU4s136